MFTYHYAQPEDYRFSLDSICFAQVIADEYKHRSQLEFLRTLDLCAGCGVIGFELLWHLPQLKQMDFVEVQTIYTEYFYQNCQIINRPELKLNWHLLNYDMLLKNEWKNKYDLILSNPPYFFAGQGVLSPSEFKNRCRFFLDSTFPCFIHAVINALDYGGSAYFLLRPAHQHGLNLFAMIQDMLSLETTSVEKLNPIRGTDVIKIRKY